MTGAIGSLAGAALALGLLTSAGLGAAAEAPVVTQHSVILQGRTIGYTAEAGRLALVDPTTGAPRAFVFYVAYRRPSPGAPRPLTFLWNGGPGSNSALLHFEAFGPKRIGDGGALEANPATLLEGSDLVFVDPVGTGYSRPADEAAAASYYGTLGDIAATAAFVQAWRTAHGAVAQPLYLGGESFGVWRAAGTAEALEKAGQRVAGVVLISGGMGTGKIEPRETAIALRLPNWTAAALHHHKLATSVGTDLDPAVAASEAWAVDRYAPALARRDSLTDAERDETVQGVARFSGLDASQVDPKTLTVTPRAYLTGLLKSEGKTLDTFDMRRTTDMAEPDRAAAIAWAFERELGWRSGLAYVGLGQAYAPDVKPVSARWNYDSGQITPEAMAAAQAGEGPPGSEPWIERAFALDPSIRVFVAAGRYDSLNSCAANADTLRRLDPRLAARFTARCYLGGHMMYRDAQARLQLGADLVAFLAGR